MHPEMGRLRRMSRLVGSDKVIYIESNFKLGGEGFALVDTTELGVDTKVFLLMKSLTLEHSGPLRRWYCLGSHKPR
jgi:hypothetical protein